MRVRWATCPLPPTSGTVLARCLSRCATTPGSSALRSLRPSLEATSGAPPLTAPERQRAARFGFDATGRRRRAGESAASVRWSLLQWPLTKGAVLRRQPEPRPQRGRPQRGGVGGELERAGRQVGRQMKSITEARINDERHEGLARVRFVGDAQQGVAAEAAPRSSYRCSIAVRGPAERGR